MVLVLLPTVARGETWTDSTGSFSVEATYLGVEERNVVLRKSDGSVIRVPIDRMSAASRSAAKRLYDEQNQAAANLPPGQAGGHSNAPRGSYPINGTLEQAAVHISDELRKGNFGVLYLMFPKSMREFIDTQEMRDELAVTLTKHDLLAGSVESILGQLVKVTATRKTFVLNSQLKQVMPPDSHRHFSVHYADFVGFLKACHGAVADRKALADQRPSEFIQQHADRIGYYARTFMFNVPDAVSNVPFFDEGTVIQQGDSGEIRFADPTMNMHWRKIDGFWIPAELVSFDRGASGDFTSPLLGLLRTFNEQPPDAKFVLGMGMLDNLARGGSRRLLEAKNQVQFNLAVQEYAQFLSSFATMGTPQER